MYPSDAPTQLLAWLRACQQAVAALGAEVPSVAPFLEASKQYWWALPDSCPFDCGPIDNAAALMEQYARLPAGLGSKADRQRFVETHEVSQALGKAIAGMEKQS